MSQCWRFDCGKPSWNGMEKEYCSLFCADFGVLCNYCQRSGCTENVPYCSLACVSAVEEQQVSMPCSRPGCSYLSWNNMPGQYCSKSCQRHLQCVLPACTLPSWDNKPNSFCCIDHHQQYTLTLMPPVPNPAGLHMCKACTVKPTHNGEPDGFCTHYCRTKCIHPTCKHLSWNKQPGQHCQEHQSSVAQGAKGQGKGGKGEGKGKGPLVSSLEVASEGGPAEPVVHYPLFLSPSQSGYAIQGIAAASALRADRFDAEELQPVSAGTSHVRSPHYRQFCGVNSPPLCMLLRKLVRKIRKPNDTDAEALLRVYTSDEQYEDGRPLFHSINQGLYKDDQQLLQACGGFIHALRWAMQDKCRKDNVSQGVVYRSVTLSAVQLEQYKVGFKFLYPNFVSTSWKSDQIFGQVKHGYTRAKFVIDLDGDGLTYALDIASCSEFSDEREVLIYPYSGFEVQDLQTEGGLTTIYLRTVDTIKFESTKHLCPIASPFSLDLSIA